MDLKLDVNGDLLIDNDDLATVDGLDAIAQDLSTRLKFFQGSWHLDTRLGMPYYPRILGEKPRINVVKSIFADAISSTPGVTAINDLVVDYAGATRALSVSSRVGTTLGTLDYTLEFIIS